MLPALTSAMTNNFGPFQLGVKVTICTHADGTHPRRIGTVKRHGIGAWRLSGCSEWYDANGVRKAADGDRFLNYVKVTCFARPYRVGDEEAIVIETKRLERHEALAQAHLNAAHNLRMAETSLRNVGGGADNAIAYAADRVAQAQRELQMYQRNLDAARAEKESRIPRETARYSAEIVKYKAALVFAEAELAAFNEGSK